MAGETRPTTSPVLIDYGEKIKRQLKSAVLKDTTLYNQIQQDAH